MKILLINIALRPPPARKSLPVGLGYIASAMTRAGFSPDILDLDANPQSEEETEAFLKSNRYDVVAMGCIVTGYKYVKWLARIVKDAHPDTVIIAGNTVAQSIPRILLEKTSVDIGVMGEGDITMIELLRCLETGQDPRSVAGICYNKNGELCFTATRSVVANIDEIPPPDWSLFDIEVYINSQSEAMHEYVPSSMKDDLRVIPINTARGCPFHCTFCYHVFQGERYRNRSPESIVKEMKHLNETFGINMFTFFDELTFHSIPQAARFADVLMASGLKVYWTADCRSALFHKDEHVGVAKKLKEAGCLWLGFALESADPDILKWMDKKVGPEAFTRQVDILKLAGLQAFTSIVIGYPNETPATIRATIDCCIENGIYPSTGYLLPQPGSPMYKYALEHGFIKDEEEYLLAMGDRQDLRLNMTSMSDEEMEAVVVAELTRCSEELRLNLKAEKLIKTGHFRPSKGRRDKREDS